MTTQKKFYDRYRVYPNNRRARTFTHLNNAIRFALSSFSTQSLPDFGAVGIVVGSGSDYESVGYVDATGYHEVAPRHMWNANEERLMDAGCFVIPR